MDATITPSTTENTIDPAEQEFEATKTVYKALEPLDDDARQRVVDHVAGMLEIVATKAKVASVGEEELADEEAAAAAAAPPGATTFGTFAELFNACSPESTAQKALVTGYWLQVCEGNPTFDAQSANKLLMHMGHRLANITSAIDSLRAQKPAPVVQTKKSGTSRQARKTYLVTSHGIEAVKAMING